MSEILWQNGAERIVLSRKPSTEFLELAARTHFTSGRRRYRRCDVADQIKRFANPACLTAEVGESTAGTYLLDEQPLVVNGANALGFYRALLCIAPDFRGGGLGGRLVESARNWMQARVARADAPGFSWGCIAGDNSAARRLLKRTGHREIGTLTTRLQYQQFVRSRFGDHLSTVCDSRIADAWTRENAAASWRPANMPTDRWLVLANGQRWIACRHHVTTLDLTPLSGVLGLFDRYLMRWFPPGRKRFDPASFRYVSASDILCGNGGDALWPRLRNELMALHGTHYVNAIRPAADAKPDLVISAAALHSDAATPTGGKVRLWPIDL